MQKRSLVNRLTVNPGYYYEGEFHPLNDNDQRRIEYQEGLKEVGELEAKTIVMVEAMQRAQILIGARNDDADDTTKSVAHNEAWWVLENAIKGSDVSEFVERITAVATAATRRLRAVQAQDVEGMCKALAEEDIAVQNLVDAMKDDRSKRRG